MRFETPITIAKAIENIQSNQYILPAIQREFVWSDKQIENMFDSLMRGYPIGSFLFWQIQPDKLSDFQFYRFMDRYHQRDHSHNEPIYLTGEQSKTAVLDGQQRLTALNIGLKGYYASKLPYYRWNSDHAFPKRTLHLNLLAKPDEEQEMAYSFKMMAADKIKNDENNFWFPVGDILRFKEVYDVFQFCNKRDLVGADLEHPSKTLVKLWKVIVDSGVINYYLEEEQNLDKVLNIFIRVNSGGTELSYSDMLLSIATAQWKTFDAREEIYTLVDDLNNRTESFNFNKNFILKSCLVLSDIKSVVFKIDNFKKDNMQKIEEQWAEIKAALTLTVRLLEIWGYNRDTLVSNNAVIPLAYYILKQGNPTELISSPSFAEDRGKMQRWLMRALLKQTLGGQSDNVLTKIRQVIFVNNNHFPENEIYEALRGTTKSMAFDEDQVDGLLDIQYGSSNTYTILALLYPWLKFDQHFHIDHIYPRNMFKEKYLKESSIPENSWVEYQSLRDGLSNLQLLQGKVNQSKSDQDFETWLHNVEADEPLALDAYKTQHMIPDVDLSFHNFPQFFEERTKIIKAKLQELLDI
jgi:uncharacterized protein with ParB-like and HNH nuclease domain